MAIYKLTAYDLTCTAITNGNYYVTTDTKQVFQDINNNRLLCNVTMIATENDRVNYVTPTTGSMYYVWETNVLWQYINRWIVKEGSYSYAASGYFYVNNGIQPTTEEGVVEVTDNNGLLRDGSVVVRTGDRIIKGKLYIDTNTNNLIISSFLGGGIKFLPSGSVDSTGALQIFSAHTYTGEMDGNGQPIITDNAGELVFYGDMYVTDGTNRFKVLTSRDGYTYEASTGIILGNTNIYILLLEEPSDWSTNYTDYYVFDSQTQQYVPNTDPTYADSTFYVQETVPNQIAVQDYSMLLKGVQVGGTTLTPDVNNMVNIPIASANDLGVVKIGSGLTIDQYGELSVTAGGGVIDDTTTGLTTTWSSNKINSELSGKADTSDVPTKTSELQNDGDGTYAFATMNDIPTVPTNVSDFNNDAGYITSADIPTDLSDFVNDVGFTVVSVTQVISTGTKIATVNVDGTDVDLYAPTGGGSSTLSGLTDVTITTPTSGEVLTYKAIPNERTASGAIAPFTTPYALPLIEHVVDIDYDANGYTGMSVTRCGKNLLSTSTTGEGYVANRYLKNQGEIATPTTGESNWFITEYTKVDPTKSLYFTCLGVGSTPSICFYDETKTFISGVTYNSTAKAISIPSTAKFFRASVNVIQDFMLVYGSTASTYESYEGTTTAIDWTEDAGTIYGGSLDLINGILTSTKASDGTDLAEPIEYSIDPVILEALTGRNNIWADTGDTEVKFIESYSDNWDNETVSLALDDISDVDLTTPTDGQVLKYDSANSKWINANESGGGATTLGGLTDVDLTTPTDGQMLSYDNANSKWVNANVPKELPTVSSLDEGKFLTVDGSGNWVATTISAWNGGAF